MNYMKRYGMELLMACLLLISFVILSKQAAQATGTMNTVQVSQTILVDAGHGGTDPGMIGTGGLEEKGINLRIAMIRECRPALCVSIHQNSYQDPAAYGPQVFYYEDSAQGKELAELIQAELNQGLEVARPRTAKGNKTYYLLKRSESVLNIVECGFLTNPEEAELLQTEAYQTKVAEAVARGIEAYLNE